VTPYREPGRPPLTDRELAAERAAERSRPLAEALGRFAAAARAAGVSVADLAVLRAD
jgi:hypothetical protein